MYSLRAMRQPPPALHDAQIPFIALRLGTNWKPNNGRKTMQQHIYNIYGARAVSNDRMEHKKKKKIDEENMKCIAKQPEPRLRSFKRKREILQWIYMRPIRIVSGYAAIARCFSVLFSFVLFLFCVLCLSVCVLLLLSFSVIRCTGERL